ncbi:hypothetical protein [uncultured Halomonas sp.]|uniref:hypothetical protein n=1 Tax=uncultured Halomonas sp. TaxID=173971 RepID=UPI002614C506|nr:hypothetical protein [uncultured Halomonas sp.]
MSADRRRITSAIQRIAREDAAIRSLLDEAQARGDQAGSAGVGVSDAERDSLCCDGPGGGTNPGTVVRDPDEGGQDADEGLDSDDPANLDALGGGSLTGLTDCATGEPVCFEGSDWVPPEGWDTPAASCYEDETYAAGCYWYVSHAGSWCYSKTSSGAIECWKSAQGYSNLTHWLNDCTPSTGACPGSQCKIVVSGVIFIFQPMLMRGDCSESSQDQQEAVDSGACDPPTDDEVLICRDHWPADGCVNLKSTPSGLVGSKYDPENDGSYSRPMAEIELCDEHGNKIGLKPTPDGGWKSIDKLRPNEDGYLYSSSGERIRRISPAEYSDTATR